LRKPHRADEATIGRVHDRRYVALVERFCAAVPSLGVAQLPTGDTTAGHNSFQIALLAAGASVDAVSIARPGAPALAVVRPPGHHAEPARGMGFCLFNNAALAAQAARAQRGATLIVDFDYHHGNGTQAWVERAIGDGAPLGFFSTHAYPAYPGTGAFSESRYAEEGFVIDIPLPLDTDTGDFVGVWSTLLPPVAGALRPKTIVISAGFDFLRNDPIAGLPVDVEAVKLLCGLIGQTAAQHDAAVALVLEGGYDLNNLRLSGELLARSFTQDAGSTHVPAARAPRDARLREMTAEVLRWI